MLELNNVNISIDINIIIHMYLPLTRQKQHILW